MLVSLALIAGAITTASATPLTARAGRTSPPAGCLAVGGTGTSSKYSTIQSAINALSTTTTSPQCVFIYRGTYHEQVTIPTLRSALTLYGETTNTATYTANTVTITNSHSQDDSPSNDDTATLRAHTPNLAVYNLNVANTRGSGSQALALSAQRDRQGFYACQFRGFQDTVLAQDGVQVYAASLIEGATDFVFGQRARAWFDGVDVRVVAASVGYVTANGRDSDANPSYYVFDRATVAARDGDVVKKGAFYLGRPWREYARVVFQRSKLEGVVNAAGWKVWNTGDERTAHVEFGEYGNTGDGAAGTRASFAKKLAKPVSIETVLGSDYKSWVDTAYLL